MDISDLRIFETVARLGSMNRASEELNTVQSNVTARIQNLEQELGTRLFNRTSRGVSLTFAGKRLLPFTARISQLLDDARRATTDTGTPQGSLSIGALETTAALRLSPVLARYGACYPQVDLTLRTGTSNDLVKQVLDQELEGAFVVGPIRHPELEQEEMLWEELAIMTAPGVDSLAMCFRQPGLKIIVLRAGCSYRLRLEAFLARHGVVNYRLLEFGTLEAIFSSVSAGLGITMLPRSLVGPVWTEQEIRVHAIPAHEASMPTCFVRRRDSYASSSLKAFLQVARDQWIPARAAAE